MLNLFLLIKDGLFKIQKSVNKIGELKESDLSGIISVLNLYNSISNTFEEIKSPFIEMLDLIDYSQFSYCSNCCILEKTLDFTLCDKCHSMLIKGEDIRSYLLNQYFSKEVEIPERILKTLHQKFRGVVNEISFSVDGKIKRRQMVDIPLNLKLRPNRKYKFFIVDETVELKKNLQKNIKNKKNKINNNLKEICRACNSKMQFLRSTVYYETTADLYKCPNCNMEKLTNFASIWESNIKDND